MKMKVGDVLYLQKYDAVFLLRELKNIPPCVFNEIFGNGSREFFVVDAKVDGLAFNCEFYDPQSIEWLMAQDWLVDFVENQYKGAEVIESARVQLDKDHRLAVEQFNSHDEQYRKEHFDKYNEMFLKTKHKLYSLSLLCKYKSGAAKFYFPGEEVPVDIAKPSKRKRVRSFFSRVFHRGGAQ